MRWTRTVLRVERILHESESVRIGAFRCLPGDPLFRDSGPILEHVAAFPRTSVEVRHEGSRPFVAGPNLATLYNRGQRYIRRAIGGQPDLCDWFALAPEILLDILRASRPSVDDRPDRPFDAQSVPTSAGLYLRQRRLVNKLMKSRGHPLEIEEETISIFAELLRPKPRSPVALSAAAREKVEAAKEIIATRLHEPLTLSQIAAAAGTSVYHLCRTFKRHTGLPIHQYREQLRLRTALERIAKGDDLLAVAVHLNYSSHSHFTSRFRTAFGLPPSVLRERLRASF